MRKQIVKIVIGSFIVFNGVAIQAEEPKLETTPSQEEIVLKPAIQEAYEMLSELKTPIEEYYHSMDKQFLPNWDRMPVKRYGQYVASITLHPEEFAYQTVLKTEEEGVEAIIAGKTIRLTFNPTTDFWTCSSGQPNGVEEEYLPIKCRTVDDESVEN